MSNIPQNMPGYARVCALTHLAGGDGLLHAAWEGQPVQARRRDGAAQPVHQLHRLPVIQHAIVQLRTGARQNIVKPRPGLPRASLPGRLLKPIVQPHLECAHKQNAASLASLVPSSGLCTLDGLSHASLMLLCTRLLPELPACIDRI